MMPLVPYNTGVATLGMSRDANCNRHWLAIAHTTQGGSVHIKHRIILGSLAAKHSLDNWIVASKVGEIRHLFRRLFLVFSDLIFFI
jgi:hypothetical protein